MGAWRRAPECRVARTQPWPEPRPGTPQLPAVKLRPQELRHGTENKPNSPGPFRDFSTGQFAIILKTPVRERPLCQVLTAAGAGVAQSAASSCSTAAISLPTVAWLCATTGEQAEQSRRVEGPPQCSRYLDSVPFPPLDRALQPRRSPWHSSAGVGARTGRARLGTCAARSSHPLADGQRENHDSRHTPGTHRSRSDRATNTPCSVPTTGVSATGCAKPGPRAISLPVPRLTGCSGQSARSGTAQPRAPSGAVGGLVSGGQAVTLHAHSKPRRQIPLSFLRMGLAGGAGAPGGATAARGDRSTRMGRTGGSAAGGSGGIRGGRSSSSVAVLTGAAAFAGGLEGGGRGPGLLTLPGGGCFLVGAEASAFWGAGAA